MIENSGVIVHVLPENPLPCGGIKVHYQLSELENELGYTSYVAFPDINKIPTWFEHSCKVINYEQAEVITAPNKHKDILFGKSLIVGWEDPSVIRKFSTPYKVCYIQGEVFVQRNERYDDITLWYSSNWNRSAVGLPGFTISPYINRNIFYPKIKPINLKLYHLELYKVLIQERKSGRTKWKQVLEYLNKDDIDRFSVTFLPDVSEKEFAYELIKADILFAHSYPEGLGLPPLEAMSCGTIVVGYSGGGGTDYMLDGKNCIMCPDGNAGRVALGLRMLLRKEFDTISMIAEGYETANSYNKERTKLELSNAISLSFRRFDNAML